jgi:hypothetical protein
MDVEVLQDHLLQERLEVEPRLVAVDVRVPVQRQDRADVRVLNSTDPFEPFWSSRLPPATSRRA